MKIELIKPIPKYILNRIKKADTQTHTIPSGISRYYSYLTKNDGELVKVTVAVRNRYSKWYYKQCAVHGVNSEQCFVKDMCYSYIGGYKVGWYAEGLGSYKKWYEDEDWGWSDDKYFRVYAPCVNTEYALRQPKYKYSACDKAPQEIILYLRLYEQFPQVEYLIKAGLQSIATSKLILRRIGKDRHFCKWLISNKQRLQNKYYYKDVVLRAYTSGRDLDAVQKEKKFKLSFAHDENYQYLHRTYDEAIVKKMVEYVKKQDISFATYKDYIRACEFLGLDLTEDKNLIPHDFRYWHDTRIDEYTTAKAMRDAEEKKAFYENFASIATKYLCLQLNGKHGFMAIIAKSPAELIIEGEKLNHCVGRMDYAQKFVKEESLIFFIRLNEKPDTPFVTVEYSPKMRKILQFHGKNNIAPDEETTKYIKNIWLPFANKQMQAMAA